MIYKDLDVWQKAMLAAEKTYRIAPQLPREETYGMRSQLPELVKIRNSELERQHPHPPIS